MAQVIADEIPGKYHLKARAELWSSEFAPLVNVHDDFVFTLRAAEDGTYRFSNFFYSGMDEDMLSLDYSAAATFSYYEGLLTVTPTPWLWDNANSTFMDPYSHTPMLYFAVERDDDGHVTLRSTPNSLGFYVLADFDGASKFYYAIDYPDEIRATRLDAYPSVAPSNLPGDYIMTYNDADGAACTTTFRVVNTAGGYAVEGLFGSDRTFPLTLDADRCGLTLPLVRDNVNGYYVNYLGTTLGECHTTFRFDRDGQWIADNPFMYTDDFIHWVDAFDAKVTRKGEASGVEAPTVNEASSRTYNLSGRPAREEHLQISQGRIFIR